MRVVLDLIAPTVCAACGTTADGELCARCAERITVCSPPWCERCGHPGSRDRCPCSAVDGFDRARSLVAFADPVRSLVLSAKRRGRERTLQAVGSLLASAAERWLDARSLNVVTSVPGGRRSNAKGFDHAERMAMSVARTLRLTYAPLLRRAIDGPRQADVAFTERWSNVAERFSATDAPERVLLIDDVFTTGATAAACGRALQRSGARSVDVLTFARTIRRSRPG